jgi:hypothetical protein
MKETTPKTVGSEIRPAETDDTSSDSGPQQPVKREQLEEEDQAFFNQKGFVTDAMPSVDVSESLEKTQKQARVREAEDEARSE